METSFNVENIIGSIINLIVFVAALILIGITLYSARSQRLALPAVINCEEQLRVVQRELEDERAKCRAVEVNLAETNTQLTDARNSIRVLNGSMLIMMSRLGIPYPDTLNLSPLVVKEKKEKARVAFVGVWAEISNLARLDLSRDLREVMESGGDWLYRPLVGKVTGTDLENELLIAGRADVVYLATHSSLDGIYFSDQKYSAAWLGEICSRYGVKLLFMNACHTRQAAAAIRAKSNNTCVVFCLREVPDRTAIAFAKAFFLALAVGQTAQQSTESAKRAVTEFDSDTPKSQFGCIGDWVIGQEEF